MPDEEHFSELLAKIIKSLQRGIDALRGTVFSDRFTSILLPIFLFKRISDVFSEESSPQILETIIRPNSFRIPKGCSWHDLISESFDLNRTLEKIFASIESENPELQGILINEYTHRAIDDRNFREVLNAFDCIPLGMTQASDEQMGEIFTRALEFLARSDGKRGGEYLTPTSVATLIAELATQDKNEVINVYDPACGSAGLLLAVANQKLVLHELAGQDINTTTLILARMNMIMHGKDLSRVNLQLGNTLEDPKHINKRFDVVVSVPPFGASWNPDHSYSSRNLISTYGPEPTRSKADLGFVQHMLHQLDNEGVMVVALPHGVLFRGNIEQRIRKHLIQELNCLDAIIGIPPNLFYGTAIPACILVFKKQRKHFDNILFIDASDEYGKERWHNYLREQDLDKILAAVSERKSVELYSEVVSIEKIRKNNFNLNLQLYIDEYRKETIHSFVEFHNLIEKHQGKNIVFRGVKDSRFEITPSIGRLPIDSTKIEESEETIFKQFKEQALPHLNFTPRNDWEWLALAQHHGLPTRLLDWTTNPLIALYFSVEEDCKSDSAVYIYVDNQPPVDLALSEYQNPLLFPSDQPVLRYTPAHLTPRIIAQSGLFTVHQNVTQGFTSEQIHKVVIPNAIRKKLKQQLYRYGIHRATIYPGLDGTSAHIKWLNCQNDEQ